MRKLTTLFALWLLIAGSLFAAWQVQSQTIGEGIWKTVSASGCSTTISPTLDANGHTSAVAISGTSAVTTGTNIITSSTNDIILAVIGNNTINSSGAAATISSISDTSSLVWTRRRSQVNYHSNESGTVFLGLDIFWAFSAAAQPSDSITVNWNSVVDHGYLMVFGINGSNSSTPFDPNVTVPATNTSLAASAPTINVSTTCPNTMLIGVTGNGASTNDGLNTTGTGYTTIVNETASAGGLAFTNWSTEVKVVTTTQSGTAVLFGTSWPNWLIYADAIRGH